MAAHYSILAWKIPWTMEPGKLPSMGSHGVAKSRTWLSDFTFYCCVVTKSCRTLCDPKDCSPPGSSVHWISQVIILELVAFSFSRGTSRPRDQTCISCTGRQILSHWAIWEAQKTLLVNMKIFKSKCLNSTLRPTTSLRKWKVSHAAEVTRGSFLIPIPTPGTHCPEYCLSQLIWPNHTQVLSWILSPIGLFSLKSHLMFYNIPKGLKVIWRFLLLSSPLKACCPLLSFNTYSIIFWFIHS